MNRPIVLLLAALPVVAAAQSYKWTDERGQVHYTQVPPKSGDYSIIGAPPPPSASPNQDALNQALDKDIKAQPERDASAEKMREQVAQREAACKKALDRVAYLDAQTPRRLGVTDDKGNTSRMSEEEFARRRSQAQEEANKNCS